jgi:hypothetical protein
LDKLVGKVEHDGEHEFLLVIGQMGLAPGSYDLQGPFPKASKKVCQFLSILSLRRHPGTAVGEEEEEEEDLEQEEEAAEVVVAAAAAAVVAVVAAQGEAAVASSLAGEAGQPHHPLSRKSTLPIMRGARRR